MGFCNYFSKACLKKFIIPILSKDLELFGALYQYHISIHIALEKHHRQVTMPAETSLASCLLRSLQITPDQKQRQLPVTDRCEKQVTNASGSGSNCSLGNSFSGSVASGSSPDNALFPCKLWM
ncbi:unnamed protein product [Protopolystoma xenopodis]|uniref:Uncharacterized protein n=1 Tax=Protopolystoma xenopodis TaxID=117903 RepID=A0A448WU50_9PLAT|nr:unnamed protein product [Protopolystoma xenopodis]